MAVIGITGGSGSGKTTLGVALRERLGPDRCAHLSQDAYYHDLSALRLEERARTDFDSPAAIELSLLATHLRALASGETVRPPRYDMVTHTRTGRGDPIAPSEHVIVEGLLLAADPGVAAAIDVLVFVDLPDAARLARRMTRDAAERGRTAEEVRVRWSTHTRPRFEAHVLPIRDRAALVVDGDADPAAAVDAILGILSH